MSLRGGEGAEEEEVDNFEDYGGESGLDAIGRIHEEAMKNVGLIASRGHLTQHHITCAHSGPEQTRRATKCFA